MTAIIVMGVIALATLFLVVSSWRRPELGMVDGKLTPCPDSPNCVSSQADDDRHVEPIAYDGSATDASERLRAVLGEMPRTRIVESDDLYLRAESTSALFRFVDDVEFLVDPERSVIDVRSASRVGRSDLDANRNRVEAIRRAFAVHGADAR